MTPTPCWSPFWNWTSRIRRSSCLRGTWLGRELRPIVVVPLRGCPAPRERREVPGLGLDGDVVPRPWSVHDARPCRVVQGCAFPELLHLGPRVHVVGRDEMMHTEPLGGSSGFVGVHLAGED